MMGSGGIGGWVARQDKQDEWDTYLPVLSRGRAGGLGELVEVPVAVDALCAVASGAAAETAEGAQAAQAHEAAVGPQGIVLLVVLILKLGGPRGWLLGGELGGPQHGGHVERAVLVGDVALGLGGRRAARGAEGRGGRAELGGRGVRGRDGRGMERGLLVGAILLALVLGGREVQVGLLVLLLRGQPRHYEVGRHDGHGVGRSGSR